MTGDKNTPRVVQPADDLPEVLHVQISERHLQPALFALDDLAAGIVRIDQARERHAYLLIRAQTQTHILLKLTAERQKALAAHIAAELQNGRVGRVCCL